MGFCPAIWLPVAEVDVSLAGILAVGFCIGSLTGLFGVGGGFLLTPILKIIFGVPYPIAVGSGLSTIAVNSSYSAFSHYRKGNVDVKMGLVMAVAALFGAAVGKSIMGFLDSFENTIAWMGAQRSVLDIVIGFCFVVLMTTMGVYMFNETRGKDAEQEDDSVGKDSRVIRRVHASPLPWAAEFPASRIARLSVVAPATAGFCVGILAGLLGVGGFVNLPILIYIFGVPTITAVGTSAVQVACAAILGSILYAVDPNPDFGVEWRLVGIMLATSLVGTRFGVFLARKFGGRKVRKYFSLILALGVLLLLYDLFLNNPPPVDGAQ